MTPCSDDRCRVAPLRTPETQRELALTAQAMDGDRERFLAAGFDGYVSKPVDIVELVATVKQHSDARGR